MSGQPMKFGPGAFRLCLAAAVLLSHLSRFDFGRPAVMLFFMLSGYWVAKMQDGPHRLPYAGYLTSRMMRVWPQLATAAIATTLLYYALHMPTRGSLTSTLALFGLATRRDDAVGTIWSLDIEAQFYLLLPAALALRAYVRRPIRLTAVTMAIFATGVVIYFTSNALTCLFYAPMFAFGYAIFLYRLTTTKAVAIGSLAAGLLLLTAVNWPSLAFAVSHPQWYRDLTFMASSAVFAPFIAWNVRQPSPRQDRILGELSFPLYLVQEPIIIVMQRHGGPWKPEAVLVCCLATAALYLAVDRPVEKLRRLVFFSAKSDVQAA
jgi:peptidoglycan/LPS O-acetylase OafA/YrhL